MRKYSTLSLIVLFTFMIPCYDVFAQEVTKEAEFTLEEITVTAEKRETTLQEVPSSTIALEADYLLVEGKVTTEEILKDIPNLSFTSNSSANEKTNNSNPNGGVGMRGVQFNGNTSDGQPPSSTAAYVDGAFQGIGGNYDINRVEILRGPQGTLYGRSSTAGVVAFYTNDPILNEFSGSATLGIGTASRKDLQIVANIPISDVFALRAAGHFFEQDGYYFNPDGGWNQTKEGRIKAKYQPTEKLAIRASLSIAESRTASGGNTAYLTAPDKIDYDAVFTEVVKSGPRESLQGILNVDYDFGESSLAFISSYRKYTDEKGPASLMTPPGQILSSKRNNPGENFYYDEIRWASDSDGLWTWLIGANYYKGDYDRTETTTQEYAEQYPGGPEDTNNTAGAEVFTQIVAGEVTNSGIFTEETFNVRDNMRVTTGLRYDKTEVVGFEAYYVNMNFDEYGNNLLPNDLEYYSISAKRDFSNFTYKLRFEYDITPDNLLYVVNSTGFKPGDIKLTNYFIYDNGPPAPTDVTFISLPEEEEKLIAYEVGSKNRFFNDSLQLNVAAFYYDYSGYRTTINISKTNAPNWIVLGTPLDIKGVEMDATWLATMTDKLSLTAGYTVSKYKKYPEIPGIGTLKYYMALRQDDTFTTTLSYDHVFTFFNGSMLVPRASLHYTPARYLSGLNETQLAAGYKPYVYRDALLLGDISLIWTSPGGNYSVIGNLKNVTDKLYKSGVSLGRSLTSNTVSIGDPRTYNVTLNIKY